VQHVHLVGITYQIITMHGPINVKFKNNLCLLMVSVTHATEAKQIIVTTSLNVMSYFSSVIFENITINVKNSILEG